MHTYSWKQRSLRASAGAVGCLFGQKKDPQDPPEFSAAQEVWRTLSRIACSDVARGAAGTLSG